MNNHRLITIAALLIAMLGAACSAPATPAPTAEPIIPELTGVPSEAAANPTEAPPPATEATGAVGVVDDSDPGSVDLIYLYMIAQQDNGKSGDLIGCEDSAVAVAHPIKPTGSPIRADLIEAALVELLAIKDQNFGDGGLYNSLYLFTMTVGDVEISNGKATVQLSGEIGSSGLCESPRIDAQLAYTVLQFTSVDSVEFFVDGVSLESILAGG
jgi:hypothetical protein